MLKFLRYFFYIMILFVLPPCFSSAKDNPPDAILSDAKGIAAKGIAAKGIAAKGIAATSIRWNNLLSEAAAEDTTNSVPFMYNIYRDSREDVPFIAISGADFFSAFADTWGDSLKALKFYIPDSLCTLKLNGSRIYADSSISISPGDTLYISPAADVFGQLTVGFSGSDGYAFSDTAYILILLSPEADTPTVTGSLTLEDMQSSDGLVITPNEKDTQGPVFFRITGITNGSLYLNDGITPVSEGAFITADEALPGLRFTPAGNFNGESFFFVQASLTPSDSGLGGTPVKVNITVTPVNDAPLAKNMLQNKVYLEDQASVELDDIAVSDVDDNEIITASLTLIGTAAGSLSNTDGARYDPSTGVWSITGGVDSVNRALSNVCFIPKKNNEAAASIIIRIKDKSSSGPIDGVISLNAIAVNDPPTLDEISYAQITYTDQKEHSITLKGISAGGGEDQKLEYSAISSNTRLVSNARIISQDKSQQPRLAFSLNPGQTGVTVITVRVTDNGFPAQYTERSFTLTVKPKPGNALSFAGTTSVAVPYPSKMNNTSFTVEFWVKPVSGTIGSRNILASSKDNAAFGFRITSDDRFEFYVPSGKSTQSVCSASEFEPEQWYHLAGTVNTNEMKFYVNGILAGSAQLNTFKLRAKEIILGRIDESAEQRAAEQKAAEQKVQFRGLLDELRIWNLARTAEQIKGAMCSFPAPNSKGLVSYLRFDQVSGTQIPNLANGAQSAVVKGDAVWTDSYAAVRPVALEAAEVTATGFRAYWKAPETGLPPQSYYLTVDDNADFSSPVPGYNGLNVGDVNSFAVTQLEGGRKYHYIVSACYNTGAGKSLASNAITLEQPLPVELVSFAANVTGNRVELIWETAVSIEDMGFQLERRCQTLYSGSTEGWEKAGYLPASVMENGSRNFSITDNNLPAGSYIYRLKQIDNKGKVSYLGELKVEIVSAPTAFVLYQNYPNPFNPQTTIKFSIPEECNVKLMVFDMLGKTIDTVLDEIRPAGTHEVSWNGSSLPPGTYYYSIQAGATDGRNSYRQANKMVLMK